MVPYLLLMFVPLLFACVAFSSEQGEWIVAPREMHIIEQHNCLIPVFFSLLVVLLALRDETIGKDLLNYQYYFNKYSSADLQAVFQRPTDVLYFLLIWLVGRFTDSYQVFLTVVAIITVLPIAVIYSQDRQNGFLKVVLFMNMSNFVLLFSGLRQAIAISVGLLAYECVKQKKPVQFLLWALLALGFHHSAFVIFTFYPLYHIAIPKKYLWFIAPAVAVVFVFNKPIFLWAVNFINRFTSEQYEATISATGAYTMLLLFVLFAALCYVIPEEEQLDKEILGLRNFMLMAVVAQCFAPIHSLAMRMNYYFIIFIPILIPKILMRPKMSLKSVAELANTICVVFFVGYYLLTTYISCKTGNSLLNTYPYVPFW